ncbi:energy transducer TonB [Ekhidna sp.]|uniref:energy transducer TonB n=1 Tax=Ekhidna sp. TaxID=2608089 RepID=UPI003514FE62
MKTIASICFILTVALSTAQELDSMSSKYPGVYTIVDEPASFPGGLVAFYDFLDSEMGYPETALKEGVEGRIFVELIVEENGELTNMRVAKGIGSGCDEEAMRAIAKSSPWNPGKINGKPVRQILIQNILFKLEDGKKD